MADQITIPGMPATTPTPVADALVGMISKKLLVAGGGVLGMSAFGKVDWPTAAIVLTYIVVQGAVDFAKAWRAAPATPNLALPTA